MAHKLAQKCDRDLTTPRPAETAINIGYSCKLIKPSMEVLILEGEDIAEVKDDLRELSYRIQDVKRVTKKVGPGDIFHHISHFFLFSFRSIINTHLIVSVRS